MANVGADQNLIARLSGNDEVGIGEAAIDVFAVDEGVIGPLFQFLALGMSEAETPVV